MAKILIVEDNEINMRLFSDLLQAKGHTVTECPDSREALAIAVQMKPDLVLMDIQMPVVSGLELTKMIRETPDIAATKIVAVSAFAMPGDKEKILVAGCDAYLSKPISIPVFFQTIEENLPQ